VLALWGTVWRGPGVIFGAVVGVLHQDEVLETGGADAGVGAYVVEVLESAPIAYGKEPLSIRPRE
jgi:hypothetical protein